RRPRRPASAPTRSRYKQRSFGVVSSKVSTQLAHGSGQFIESTPSIRFYGKLLRATHNVF
ncbi:MAG: hypothetical protein LBL27_04395, partial [Coriobacteriales bacterium]|nr:hypothetical protein [Coriobacteriales bacterium]